LEILSNTNKFKFFNEPMSKFKDDFREATSRLILISVFDLFFIFLSANFLEILSNTNKFKFFNEPSLEMILEKLPVD